MSGICGIWNLDGAPVSPPILAAMTARLAHRGLNGEHSLIRGSLGTSYQKLAVTPESINETQPAVDGSGLVLLWDGRLDNREDLVPLLAGLTLEAPDVDFVLAAYRQWGETFVSRLVGDFALALFDPSQARLFLARDPMGPRTLYYCQVGQEFLFGSEIKALLAHPRVQTAPDDDAVAEWIYQIPDFSDPTRTFYRDIKGVPAGTVMRVSPEGIKRQRHWDLDVHRQLRFQDYDDYVAAYRECFDRAVRRRLRSAFPVAMAVSGGLDSSSIYCVAKEIAPNGVGGKDIIAMALVPEDPLANEDEYQRIIEEKYHTSLLKLPLVSAPMVAAARGEAAWFSEGPFLKWDIWRDFSRLAVDKGARVLFSGFFGDHLLTNPHYILDLLARGRFHQAFRHTRDYFDWWEGLDTRFKLAELSASLKGYLVPDRVRPLYHGFRRKLKKRSIQYLPWFSPKLAEAAARIERERSYLHFPGSRMHAKIIYQYLHSRLLNLRLDMEFKMDAEFPYDSVMPFRDRDLVQMMVSLPGEVAYQAGSRGIHREAMRGILPEAVRLRRSKAMFLEPARRGAQDDLARLRSSLLGGAAQRLGYLQTVAGNLDQALGYLDNGLPAARDATLPWATNDLVALEEWCTAFFDGSVAEVRV